MSDPGTSISKLESLNSSFKMIMWFHGAEILETNRIMGNKLQKKFSFLFENLQSLKNYLRLFNIFCITSIHQKWKRARFLSPRVQVQVGSGFARRLDLRILRNEKILGKSQSSVQA